jgi:Uma2 family endonuclease
MTTTGETAPEITLPPTQEELPYDDGVPMETYRHKCQMDMLIDGLDSWLAARDDGFVSGNMFVYYSLAQLKNQDFKGPDFFVVLGVPKGERKSWVVWEEGKTPDVIIELLSESTAERDKNEKKLIYQNQMHVPEYFWYDPFNSDDWAGLRLSGGIYETITVNTLNQLTSQVLGLGLQRWQGSFRGIDATWLRWATLEGELLPLALEIATAERQRAEQAESQLQQVQSQLLQTARNLLQEGMTVEQVARLTGLSASEIEELFD